MQCCQLHNHTEFSLLDGAAKIDKLVKKAHKDGMPAIGISDHGNMFGVPKFVLACRKLGIKPIVGCEFYLARESRHNKTRSPRITDDEGKRGEKDTYHQILFAKDDVGYRNLLALTSASFTEGYYYKPRIDKELLLKHHEGLIATTCCLASEVHQALMNRSEAEAELVFKWWLDMFGEDYYIELQRHGLKDQDKNNMILLKWADKYNVKVICTNDVHYVDGEDSEAHDLLLALQTGADLDDPNRFRFTYDDDKTLNPNFFFKNTAEMAKLFEDVPQALANTVEIADKCSLNINLTGKLLLPTFAIPEGFPDDDAYLAHLSWERAPSKYKEITAEVEERINNELAIIKQMGFAGYFLIVQEFTKEARNRGVYVGPGRGSAAGSVVAYVIGITDVDPIEYSLFFERFLNPERVSPPDIDIDFDDEGRQQVIDFVVDKYGKQSVSQIITYGTMGAKTAIRDVGRVLKVPLQEVNRIAKFIPEKPGIDFDKALTKDDNPEHAQDLKDAIDSPDPLIKKMMGLAIKLEGTPRQTGIHAAGVIIAPGRISDYCPVAINNSREEIVITQYDGPMAEAAGLLKMDFLGLKTLSIIKTAIHLIKETKGIEIDPDHIPLDDLKTYELYQRGETVATFQFESDGMRKHLKALKPTTIEDLIAMNALYRPGPMDNIPSFIRRKHGQETVAYPHPLLEPILRNTYGIMVYQEQIMEAAKVLGGYTLGGADLLRRAMGKKKVEEMAKERAKFLEGTRKNGLTDDKANEIFDLMEKFAGYGFNKSHAAAYSILAFRTAYLKANYPHEYMAAVLSHNLSNIEKISFFIEETKAMGIDVLPPCVNESRVLFSVNAKGHLRFGLGAIKGVGESVAQGILEERLTNGPYTSVFDLTARLDKQLLNRKTLESLAYAGALDSCSGTHIHRAQFFCPLPTDAQRNILDLATQYGVRVQESKNSNQAALFGGGGDGAAQETLAEPEIPRIEPWPDLVKLNYERDVIGFYLSGHPMDRFELEIGAFCNTTLEQLPDRKGRDVAFAGIVTAVKDRVSKTGSRFGAYTLEDKTGKTEFMLFKDQYANLKGHLELNNIVFVRGKMEPSFRDPTQHELKITELKMMEGLLEAMTRRLEIQLHLNQVQPDLIQTLNTLLAEHKGKVPLRFVVGSETYPKPLAFTSRNTLITPSNDLIRALKTLEVRCRLG